MTTFTIKTTRTFHRGLATTTFDLPEFMIEASTRTQACLHAGSLIGKDSEEITHEITVHEYPTEQEYWDSMFDGDGELRHPEELDRAEATYADKLALYDSLPDFDPSL